MSVHPGALEVECLAFADEVRLAAILGAVGSGEFMLALVVAAIATEFVKSVLEV